MITSLDGSRVLVTGGTGSLGKVLVRRILSGEMGTPAKLVVMSRDEGKQHDMRVAYLQRTVTTDEVIYRNFKRILQFRIGDVRDYGDVVAAVRDADIVINAAALKQVPTCEYFPDQAVLTNTLGAANIVRAVTEHDLPVDTVVGVSTDKACKPINVMGMSKALQERIFIGGNIRRPATRFVCVRYGNVMASRGSVIPLFHEQIRTGGPVTITHPEMTRFLLSIDDAVGVIFHALRFARAGEIVVPRIPSATVVNIAEALIGDRGIELVNTGIRPGEKLHEIMISEEEAQGVVRRGNYYAILPMLPELRTEGGEVLERLDGAYSSADHVVDLARTVDILVRHDLMVGRAKRAEGGELLR